MDIRTSVINTQQLPTKYLGTKTTLNEDGKTYSVETKLQKQDGTIMVINYPCVELRINYGMELYLKDFKPYPFPDFSYINVLPILSDNKKILFTITEEK